MTSRGPDESPAVAAHPNHNGKGVKATLTGWGAVASWFVPGATARHARALEVANREHAARFRADAERLRAAADQGEPGVGADILRRMAAQKDESAAKFEALAERTSPAVIKARVRESMARPDGRSAPLMPKPLNRNWFTTWILGLPWMILRDGPWLGPLFGFAVAVLGIGTLDPIGIVLGVVIGIPGIVVPIYGWAGHWRRNWTALASTALLPATFAALLVLANVEHW